MFGSGGDSTIEYDENGTDQLTIAGAVTRFTNTTQSTSKDTGSVIFEGGIGVEKDLSIGGNVSIGGTLTYEDVTNIDSVGIVTAREGVFLPDLKQLKIGNTSAAPDLYLWHNSSTGNSNISNKTGDLFIQGNNGSGTVVNQIAVKSNAAVELNHQGNKKLSTIGGGNSANGIEVFGNASNSAVRMSTSDGTLRGIVYANSSNLIGFLGNNGNWALSVANAGGNTVSYNHFNPSTDSSLDLGTGSVRWRNVYADTLYGNGANLTGIDTDLVSDTSPQLGGTLDVNGQVISFDDATGVNVNRAKFGTGNDLHIYHNGSNSTIRHEGTGSLLLTTVSGSIQLLNGSENMLIANPNGGVQLYYDNSIKLETISTGIRMQNSSELTVNGGTIQFGHSSSSDDRLKFGANGTDLQIFHGGNGQFDVNTGDVIIRNTGDFSSSREIYLMARVDEQSVTCYSDGGVELYYNNGRQLQTLSNGIKPDNNLFMNDNKPIYIGNGLDLQIYHDGSNSFIKDGIGSSGLVVQAPLFAVKSADGSENMIVATQNGNVELMHNNTKMLETLNEGIKVHTGSSSTVIRINSNTNVESIIQGYNSDLLIKSPSSGNITLYANGTESAVNCIANGAVELYHNGNRQVFTFDGGLNWQDTKKAEFGNSGDLKIYHNGSNSAVQNYQGALYISNKETNSSDLHLQGKDSIQMHCPSDGTIVQKIDNNRLTTFDVGAPSSSNKTIARFQSESSRKLDVVWHDSGSYMGFDTPGNHPYMFKVNGSSALEINTYREVKTEESSHGWSTYEMHAKDGGTRFHYRGIGAGSSGTTINLIRVRRHYWGSGWYHIKLRQRYYNGSAEGHWWLHGHGRNTGGHSPSWQLNHTNHNNLGGSKVQITSNSNSSPGNDYSGYVDVYANIGAYEYYEVVIETSLMSGYNHGVANVGNDSYALHAF